MDPVISVRHLSHRYGRKLALDDVSFDVPRGRVFGLVGENGAGKTTLMKHLLGALCPDEGDVRVLGVEPTRNPVAVLSRIGYLSEDRDLPGWMRIRELLRYTKAFYPNWDDAYAEDLRKCFRLPEDAKVRNLSRGEKARAGLLTALAHRPEILLLDEPSSGLDPVSRHDILGVVVKSVAEEGRTVVFSSHLLDEVERVVDDVAMIRNGRLELLMPVDELRATHHRIVVAFDEPQTHFPRVDCVVQVEGEGREWAVICQGTLDETSRELQSAGAAILETTTPTLDAVFVARVLGGQPASVE